MSQRTPASEQRRLVARWRQSGQSQGAFAHSIGIPQTTFATWTRKYAAEEATSMSPPGFIEVTPVPIAEPISLRLAIPGRLSCELSFDTLPPPGWLAVVLREMTAC